MQGSKGLAIVLTFSSCNLHVDYGPDMTAFGSRRHFVQSSKPKSAPSRMERTSPEFNPPYLQPYLPRNPINFTGFRSRNTLFLLGCTFNVASSTLSSKKNVIVVKLEVLEAAAHKLLARKQVGSAGFRS